MSKIWLVKCTDELKPHEVFVGITKATFINNKEKLFEGFIGQVEVWETASRCTHKNCNIKFYQKEIDE